MIFHHYYIVIHVNEEQSLNIPISRNSKNNYWRYRYYLRK